MSEEIKDSDSCDAVAEVAKWTGLCWDLWAAHETLMRAGASPDDLFVQCGNDGHVALSWRRAGADIVLIDVGRKAEGREVFQREWLAFVAALGDGSLSDEALGVVWTRPDTRESAKRVVMVLIQCGVPLPGELRARDAAEWISTRGGSA